jgi:hypothetical protein
MRSAAQKWAPVYAQVSAECAAMPKGGKAEAAARAARAIEILMSAAGRDVSASFGLHSVRRTLFGL